MASVAFAQQDSGFQERYAANLQFGESYVSITNSGANTNARVAQGAVQALDGAPLLGPGIFGSNTATGNICVNVYAIDPNEELISCCSCLVTPDQTVNLGVNVDLTSNTQTGVVPTSVTVALVATLAGTGGSATSCTYSAGIGGAVVNGMSAWGTTLQRTAEAAVVTTTEFTTTETSFTPVSGSAGGTGSNLASLVGRCASIIGNSSGHGICKSCTTGAIIPPI
jgi:hypothetical protein